MDIGIKNRKALSLQLLEIGTTNPAFFMHLQKKAYFNTDKALLNPQDRRNRFKRHNKRNV